MIGSRVTVDAPRERKQLGAFGKMSGLSSRPASPPFDYFFVTSVSVPWRDSRLPERKWKRLLRRSHFWKAVDKTRNLEHSGTSRNIESRVRVRVSVALHRKHGPRTRVSRSCNPAYSHTYKKENFFGSLETSQLTHCEIACT